MKVNVNRFEGKEFGGFTQITQALYNAEDMHIESEFEYQGNNVSVAEFMVEGCYCPVDKTEEPDEFYKVTATEKHGTFTITIEQI